MIENHSIGGVKMNVKWKNLYHSFLNIRNEKGIPDIAYGSPFRFLSNQRQTFGHPKIHEQIGFDFNSGKEP